MTQEKSDFYQNAIRIINALPHRRLLNASHIDRVISFVDKNPNVLGQFSVDEFFARYGKLGASELGAFVAHERGENIDIGASAREIAMRKLMLIDPVIPTPKMMRGTYLEKPIIRPMFLAKFGATSLLDHPAVMAAMASPSEATPWLNASIDDLISIELGGETMRFLPDYKCPDPKTVHAPISLNYHVQLEMYAAKLEEKRHFLEMAGLIQKVEPVIHGKILARFDLNEWDVAPSLIDMDLALRAESIQAGDKWAYQIFNNACIPEPIHRAELFLSNERKVDVDRYAKSYVYWRFQEEQASLEKNAASVAIQNLIHDQDGSSGMIKTGGVNINVRPKYDEECLIQLARDLDVNLSRFEVRGKGFQPELVENLIQQAAEYGTPIQARDLEDAAVSEIDFSALGTYIEEEFGVVPSGRMDVSIRVTSAQQGANFEIRNEIEEEALITHGHNREYAVSSVYPYLVNEADISLNHSIQSAAEKKRPSSAAHRVRGDVVQRPAAQPISPLAIQPSKSEKNSRAPSLNLGYKEDLIDTPPLALQQKSYFTEFEP